MISLNHIGIAAAELPKLKKLFSILGLEVGSTEDVPDQGVKTHFLPLPPVASSIELLEPIDPEGVVSQFISKRGPGIHHLSFLVDQGELTSLSQKLVKEGFRLIYPQSKRGAHGMKVNFIHPSSAGGILIEIMEPGDGG